MKIPLAYRQGAVFGCDIGSQTVKVVQLGGTIKHPKVIGYGYAPFDPKFLTRGVITAPDKMGAVIKALLLQPQGGHITAKRVVASLPISSLFVRSLNIPPEAQTDLAGAVELEAEQYVPLQAKDIYVTYDVLAGQRGGTALEVEMVASPKTIIDSYIKLFDTLGMFTSALEVGQAAIMRSAQQRRGDPMLLADFGSEMTDIVISDQAIRLSSSVPVGGNQLTEALKTKLNITTEQANEIKHRYGIGPSGLRHQIMSALKPALDQLQNEITKAMKYYHERSGAARSIQRIILSGGSAYMPGLMEYYNAAFRLPVAIDDPWEIVDFGTVPPPAELDRAMYTTAVGLALRGLTSD